MRLLNFTIIRLTVCLIIGILIGYFTKLNVSLLLFICPVLIVLLSVTLFFKKYSKKSIWSGIIIYLTTICCGILSITVHNQSNFSNHYTKSVIIDNNTSHLISFRIREVLKPGSFHNKYTIDILKIDDKNVLGRSLLNVIKDSSSAALKVDDILLAKTQFKDLIPPLNPHQFDYKNYLKKKHIYHQLFLSNNELFKVSNEKHTIYGYASSFREMINVKLDQLNFDPDVTAIINALLLGQRQDISKEIYDSYTQAGAIHILAVSGLHVGIILFLLNFLFKPIEQFRHGIHIKTVLLVAILWGFAIVAGLSASVVRAVTMFTIVAIALNLKRPTNVYNTLAISMFFLLLVKPTFLFDVGFQLSYLAVFAIVIIQPMLFNSWSIKNRVIKFFWSVFTVSIAAQIGVLPISLYYFHQFPGLFLISNMVIIPFLGIILGYGIIVIGLALGNLLPDTIARSFAYIIDSMNVFVSWISDQEAFILKHISFSLEHVLISYLLIALIINLFKVKTARNFIFLLFGIVVCQTVLIINKKENSANSFIVFHKSRHSIIGHKKADSLYLYLNIQDSTLKNHKMISNYNIGAHIKNTKVDSTQNVYLFNNRKLLVVDSLGVYNTNTFKPDMVLLQYSPKINLERLINTLQPDMIISDGSNYKSYQKRWAKTCEAKKIPFHQTSKKGAFIYCY